MFKLRCIILMLFICISCSAQQKGKIISSLTIKKDTTLTYSIYFPTSTISSKVAFIFFDPSGNGAFPISMYKNLANKYGIILIGNNNSKNGMDFFSIEQNFNLLLDELKVEYKIESKNCCVWGFSGGAKAAMYCASKIPSIKYCIYGGAYFQTENNIDFLGFNGIDDMNYTDVLAYGFTEEKKNSTKHLQIEFAGKHAWPDTVTASNAFQWFLLKKMQKKEIKQDKILIAKCFLLYKKEIDKNLANKNYRQAFSVGKKAIITMDNVFDVSYFKVKVNNLVNDPIFLKEMKLVETNYKTETDKKSIYQHFFLSKDSVYWKDEISKLTQESKFDKTGINNRLLGFLSLASYSYALQAFNDNDISILEKILFIYRQADPTNPEQALMRARLFILKKDVTQAKSCLQEAIDLGIDKNRIENDAALKAVIQP